MCAHKHPLFRLCCNHRNFFCLLSCFPLATNLSKLDFSLLKKILKGKKVLDFNSRMHKLAALHPYSLLMKHILFRPPSKATSSSLLHTTWTASPTKQRLPPFCWNYVSVWSILHSRQHKYLFPSSFSTRIFLLIKIRAQKVLHECFTMFQAIQLKYEKLA